MGRPNHQRSGLPSGRQVKAGFGARHPIDYDDTVARFFNALDAAWGEILPDREEGDRLLTGLPASKYKLYRDAERIGITVLERRLSEKHARTHRVQWEPSDVGRIRGRLTDTLSRLEAPDDVNIDMGGMPVTLSVAVRVGDAERPSHGAKFALVAEAGDPASGFLAEEHEIIVGGLSGVLRDFRYPYDEYVPKLTIGRIYRGASAEQIQSCAEAIAPLLPLPVVARPIMFLAHQQM